MGYLQVGKFSQLLSGAFCGTLLYLAFRSSWWWLAIIAIALLYRGLIDCAIKSRFYRILGCSIAFFALLLSWLKVVGSDAWLLLILLCTVTFLLLALIPIRAGSRQSQFEFALGFVVVEFLRSSYPWGGFSWGLVAYSQNDGPIVKYSRLGGSALVAFLVVIIACLLAEGSRSRRKLEISICLSILFAPLLISSAPSSGTLKVAVVQGGVVPSNVPDMLRPQRVLDHHIAQTRAHKELLRGASLVIWPENAAQIFDGVSDTQTTEIQATIDSIGVPFLVGAVIERTDLRGPLNSGILWWPKVGQTQRYVKNHLVPFGEYIPLRKWLANHVGRLGKISSDFTPGQGGGVIKIGALKIGDAICFEVADQDHLHNLISGGAQIFVAQSNNATYLNTNQPSQQFEITRFSAIAHQRSFVVATTSGVSGVIAADGRVLTRVDTANGNVFLANVSTVDSQSPVDRFPAISSLSFICALIWCIAHRVRNRRAKMHSDKLIS